MGSPSAVVAESMKRKDSVCSESSYLLQKRYQEEGFDLIFLLAIELNLRLPSMLHGKKGFERIVWAFKNVLNQSLAWLFCDLDPKDLNDGETFHPCLNRRVGY